LGWLHFLLHNNSGVLCVIVPVIGFAVLAVAGWLVGRALDGRLRAWTESPGTPDLIRSPAEVWNKTWQTTRLMERLAHRDHLFDPPSLREWTGRTFCLVQQCWQERNYEPLSELLMPDILEKHQELLESMRRNQVVNRIEELQIERLEFVHLYCPQNTDSQEFTALITFTAKIYFVNDIYTYIGGPREQRRFQEFWIFRRQSDSWKLQAIEQSRQSDRLESENRV
jgi:predicted lipid-binding transport protein (Tim44 family)